MMKCLIYCCIQPGRVHRPSLDILPEHPTDKRTFSISSAAATSSPHPTGTNLQLQHPRSRSRSLYSCLSDGVDRLHQRPRPKNSSSSSSILVAPSSSVHGRTCQHHGAIVSETVPVTSSRKSSSGVVLRLCDIVHRGSLLSTGTLLSAAAASRRASCPETSRLAPGTSRSRCQLVGSMTVSEGDEQQSDADNGNKRIFSNTLFARIKT